MDLQAASNRRKFEAHRTAQRRRAREAFGARDAETVGDAQGESLGSSEAAAVEGLSVKRPRV